MLTNSALDKLSRELQACIESFGLRTEFLGQPGVVEKSAKEAERTFQGYAKAKPNREDAYAAARDFIHGKELDSWKRDLIASVLADPIPAAANGLVLANPMFPNLLSSYDTEVKTGDLWRLTWHGLLSSYFAFNPVGATDVATKGWESLREFLARTWPSMNKQSGESVVPDWMLVLRLEAEVLTKNPVDKYAAGFLNGRAEAVDRLKSSLGIPPSSWFWHQLVLNAVCSATNLSDLEFQRLIPRLIELVRERPAFRDEAIERILIRYHACIGARSHDELRDFVINNDVWRNPKLKDSGIAPAWNRVPGAVWRMVMAWVTERALKDFFDILATRNSSDAGRLAFWSKYLQQITWTRLVFGSETMALQHSNKAIRDLIARERGDFAELTFNKHADAFMMQIGDYIAVEFSITSNAAYVYDVKSLKFDRHAKYYRGDPTDLKFGFRSKKGLRILHSLDWELSATQELKHLGIYPDAMPTVRVVSSRAVPSYPSAAPPLNGQNEELKTSIVTQQKGDTQGFSMAKLQHLVNGFNNARINDERGRTLGRLWVEDAGQSRFLAGELEKLGFWWSTSREAWYYRGK